METSKITSFISWDLRRWRLTIPLITNHIIISGGEAVPFQSSSQVKKDSAQLENDPQDSHNHMQKKASHDQLLSSSSAEPPFLTTNTFSSSSSGSYPNHTSSSSANNAIQSKDKKISISTSNRIQEQSDDQISDRVARNEIRGYSLEKDLNDPERAVKVRRMALAKTLQNETNTENTTCLEMQGSEPKYFNEKLPWKDYDYQAILGACCENVIGYVPVPVGVAGPLLINNSPFYIPMATTEGCLVASTTRGCKAINSAGGLNIKILKRGMTRAPAVKMPTLNQAIELKEWLENPQHSQKFQEVFSGTSHFLRLVGLSVWVTGRTVYIRIKADTADAMGMNMITKGVDHLMNFLKKKFPEAVLVTVSSNLCTDKKASAINWIEGRGRTVTAEVVIKKSIIETQLKTSVPALVELNTSKNLVGSALSGTLGGFNAHAANIVTAIFLATGQDCAQNVESSNCITVLENTLNGDLLLTLTMPSLEVGTVGGGTFLSPQNSMLSILGISGPNPTLPGKNADILAQVICGATCAGELSLLSALAGGDLMKAHSKLNTSLNRIKSAPDLMALGGE